ncbi:MAG: site-specific DNA-methyltransferase [Verrucomicrobiaceae bacterium]|nr:MAG: site-specific DNA-methyltransferase [Verrucomicrobiaceae bacterium]
MQSFLNSDCISTMMSLKPGSVKLAVTSPPYNADKKYETNLALAEYEAFADAWVSQIPRLLSDDGSFWLNVGYTKLSPTTTLPLTYLYYPIAIRHGLHLIQEIVWHYEGGMAYKSRFSHRTERWMWFAKDPTNYLFHLDAVRDPKLNRTIDKRNNVLGKNPTDYWYFDRVVGGNGKSSEKTSHPCQFPVPMIDRIIKACSNPGDTILDPFGGSGSTAVSAYNNYRSFVSIERDPEYHAAAMDRLTRSDRAKMEFIQGVGMPNSPDGSAG